MRTDALRFLLTAIVFWPPGAAAWEEQQVLEYIMAHNTVLRAYRVVTANYTPVSDTMDRGSRL